MFLDGRGPKMDFAEKLLTYRGTKELQVNDYVFIDAWIGHCDGDKDINLDGYFTVEQLQAIIEYMKAYA